MRKEMKRTDMKFRKENNSGQQSTNLVFKNAQEYRGEITDQKEPPCDLKNKTQEKINSTPQNEKYPERMGLIGKMNQKRKLEKPKKY